MWKLALVLALPLAPLAATHAASGVGCEVRAVTTDGGVALEGVAASGAPLSGTYRFEVRMTGPSGSSTSQQSGTLEMPRGEKVVGRVGLGRLEREATYEAELVLQWQGGEASCTASGPDGA